jgi:beta-glucosidase
VVAIPFARAQEPAWPRPLGLAASWDPELVREVHAEIAARARARGARLVEGPSLEVARDPRLGRMESSFGADTHLVAELGVAAIRGLQGDGGPQGVLAAVSGFAGPGSPRPGTDVSPAPTSERELREVYFPPFEAAVRRGKVAAIIPARNDIDGVPSHANAWLLKDVLRGEWGFTGSVLADHGAVAELHRVHRVAASDAQALALARASGIDASLAESGASDGTASAREAPRSPASPPWRCARRGARSSCSRTRASSRSQATLRVPGQRSS